VQRDDHRVRSLTPRECLIANIGSVIESSLGSEAIRTTASLGQLGESQNSVVTGNWLKGDVAVPSISTALLLRGKKAALVELLGLLGADD
jgi:hypothetical protein